MKPIVDRIFSLLTSGKYTEIKDEKEVDSIIRIIVLNIIYTLTAILIAGVGVTDMQSGSVDFGLIELILGFLILTNLLLLRTELPFTVGGFIIIAVYGCFCALSIFTKNESHSFTSTWVFSYPLVSIFTLGLVFGLVPSILLFLLTILSTFFPGISRMTYTVPEALVICGVYFFILALTVVYEYVRSMKDHWLSRQDSYINLVFKNSPDIIMLLDKDGNLAYCADAFLKKAHVQNLNEIIKTDYTKVFSLFSNKEQVDEIVGLFNTGRVMKKPVVFERTMDIDQDGDYHHYEIHFTPMYDATGDFQGAFILFHDMTEIIEAKKRTEQASTAKSNFLSSMSHEIRTPLNAIIGMTTIATSSPDPERKDYCLSKISGASVHLLGIINDILDMSKIEEGKLELSPTEFEFSAMLTQIINIFEFRLGEKRQKLIVETDPGIPARIIADEQRFAQVITNLLSNAIKFTPDEGSIGIKAKLLEREDDSGKCTLEIQVSDSGIGISINEQGKLFNSFVQVDSSISRKYGGTGLGLAISKNIVEAMEGSITIDSEPGKGSTFIFTIKAEVPKQKSLSSETESSQPIAGAEPEAVHDYSGKRILLAEDVEINREIVIALLEDYKLEIIEAEDGQYAYDKFAANPDKFDLVFMDIHMPGVNGYESTRLIRALDHPRAKTVPIIAMTANVFKEDIENCLEAGMNAHIGKPLALDDLNTILRKYLED